MTITKPPCDKTASGTASAKRREAAPIASKLPLVLLQNASRNLPLWFHVLARAPLAQTPPLPARAIAAIILVLAAIVASMFLVDTAASDWARHLPQWFRDTFEHISDFGLGGWFLVPFGLIVLSLAALTSPALPRMMQGVLAALAARFAFLFLAIGAPGLFTTIVKRLIGRARPYVGGHDDPFAYMPFIWRPEYASMPSGHATNAAAAAIAIGAIWPRARVVMWPYAFLIMFSRVVVLAHHPSDVIAGALVGVVGALAVRRWFAARRLVFSASGLKAYPAPSLRRIRTAVRRVIPGRGRSPRARNP